MRLKVSRFLLLSRRSQQPNDPLDLHCLNRDTLMAVGDYLSWDDRLSLMRVDHSIYNALKHDWLGIVHGRVYQTDFRLSLRSMYTAYVNSSESEKEKILELLQAHPHHTMARHLFEGKEYVMEDILKFINFQTGFGGGELLEMVVEDDRLDLGPILGAGI